MRATIRRDSLTLVPTQLASVHGGPMGCMARAALRPSVSIADLIFNDQSDEEPEDAEDIEADEEEGVDEGPEERIVEVRFLANDVPAARRVLRRWAAVTGHDRIWFRDEVCDLEPPDGVDGEFRTRCPSCGLEIVDSGPALMKFVRKAGHFPMHCFTCGGFVPQWEPVRREARDRTTTPGRSPAHGEDRVLRVVDA